jgi:hypothetical protein
MQPSNLDEGNASQALSDLEAVRPYELGGAGTTINYVYPAYLRGEAYLLAHNANAAAAEFQKLLDHGGIVLNFVTERWFISNLPARTRWPVILPRREWPIRTFLLSGRMRIPKCHCLVKLGRNM